MTQNSYICQIIAENPEWRDVITAKAIKIKESGSYAIFNYITFPTVSTEAEDGNTIKIACDFNDPVVQESRGIIIDTEKAEVVCWPFRKFGNWQESYVDPIDWNTARVQEKVDGSIVKLWFDKKQNAWTWSTNSVIDANEAEIVPGVSYFHGISHTPEYRQIPFDKLDHDCTYIFEFITDLHRIVVKHTMSGLIHTGTRSNVTGEEFNIDIGIKKPKEYPLHSLDDCVKAAEALNIDASNVTDEGYVVVDAQWHRIKIKSPQYVYAHHMISEYTLTKKNVCEVILNAPEQIDELIRINSDAERVIRYYQWQLAEYKFKANAEINKARALYEEFEHDRGAVAKEIKKNKKWAWFGFKGIGNQLTADDMLPMMSISNILKDIPDYPL